MITFVIKFEEIIATVNCIEKAPEPIRTPKLSQCEPVSTEKGNQLGKLGTVAITTG